MGPSLSLTVSFFNSHFANFTENNLYALCVLQPSSQRENGQTHSAAYTCKYQEHQQPQQAACATLVGEILPGWDLCILLEAISASELQHVKVGHCPHASIRRPSQVPIAKEREGFRASGRETKSHA